MASLAIAVAVSVLSPVTILTVIPALLQAATAYGIPSLSGSLIPVNPMTVKLLSKSSATYPVYNYCFDNYL